jgi:hypothetical protein
LLNIYHYRYRFGEYIGLNALQEEELYVSSYLEMSKNNPTIDSDSSGIISNSHVGNDQRRGSFHEDSKTLSSEA